MTRGAPRAAGPGHQRTGVPLGAAHALEIAINNNRSQAHGGGQAWPLNRMYTKGLASRP